MTFSNPWFIAALVGVLGLFHLEIIATFLNLAQFRHALPQRLKEIFSDETVQKAGEYAASRPSSICCAARPRWRC
jgi:STE24 endopeptidase